MPNLRKLNFSNHRDHQDGSIDGYAYTAKLVDLLELNFSYSDICYSSFIDMSGTLKSVTVLDLTACRHLSGTALVYISKFVSLKQLDISFCQKITNESLKQLSAFESIILA